MSLDTLSHLNWLAVVVATIVYFVIGAVWSTRHTHGPGVGASVGL